MPHLGSGVSSVRCFLGCLLFLGAAARFACFVFCFGSGFLPASLSLASPPLLAGPGEGLLATPADAAQ